jgi:AGZA family xanthine/uracil permease-like MFS transporter
MQNADRADRRFVFGDVNGFFGLMFDNMAVLSFLGGTLILGFNFPAEIIYTRMFPGTTFGVLVGDLFYTWMAWRLGKKTGRADVTAMPLGLDTPSTIGLAVAVLGPAFLAFKQAGHSAEEAAFLTWYLGMATMVMIGIVKVVLSFCGNWVQRTVPRAGLLGSLAGVGLALIGFIPLVDIFGVPLVGMLSLGLVLYTLVARIPLPGKLPGLFTAIVVGTLLYHISQVTGYGAGVGGTYVPSAWQLHFGLPIPTLDFVQGIVPALKYLPLAIPFAILTVVGGINVTESARVAGDDFDTRQILLGEAFATLVAGVCGGVAQSCPYIGHPAYKRMGARLGYTLLTGAFIGLGGFLGYVSFIVELIPRAVLAPILVFVALEITAQAFLSCHARYAPAVILAILPSVARLVSIYLEIPEIVSPATLQHLVTKAGQTLPEVLVIIALGNGFILTGMLWGAFLAEMIDRRLRVSALYLFILSAMTFFGIVHSASLDANVYLPWMLTGVSRLVPYQFALSYASLGVLVFLFSYSGAVRDGPTLDFPAPAGSQDQPRETQKISVHREG